MAPAVLYSPDTSSIPRCLHLLSVNEYIDRLSLFMIDFATYLFVVRLLTKDFSAKLTSLIQTTSTLSKVFHVSLVG